MNFTFSQKFHQIIKSDFQLTNLSTRPGALAPPPDPRAIIWTLTTRHPYHLKGGGTIEYLMFWAIQKESLYIWAIQKWFPMIEQFKFDYK